MTARLFLVNPSTRSHEPLADVERWFRERDGGFEAVVTRDREDVIRRTRDALRAGARQIVALGGDGTVNAVANGFFDENGAPISADAMLAVAPWGTGCDYWRSIAGGGAVDWKETVLAGHATPTDVGRLQYRRSGGVLHFVNAASVGLSAEVVRRQRAMPRWLPALASYSLPSAMGLLTFRPVPLVITLDGKRYDGEFLSAFFAKGTHLGGGMRFGGNVAADDGRLDVTLLHGMSLAESLPRFGKIYTGRFHGDRKITKTTASEILIEAPAAQPMELDGELEGTTDVEVRVLRRAVRVCRPA